MTASRPRKKPSKKASPPSGPFPSRRPRPNLEKLERLGTAPIHTAITAYDLLRRNDVDYEALRTVFDLPELAADVEEEIEIMIKYEAISAARWNKSKR